VRIGPPCLTLALEREELAQLLGRQFLIERNGSVSDRLWRLVIGVDDEEEALEAEELDAQWLAEIPDRVWDLVRDTVLRRRAMEGRRPRREARDSPEGA
jgi:hypothetical protein